MGFVSPLARIPPRAAGGLAVPLCCRCRTKSETKTPFLTRARAPCTIWKNRRTCRAESSMLRRHGNRRQPCPQLHRVNVGNCPQRLLRGPSLFHKNWLDGIHRVAQVVNFRDGDQRFVGSIEFANIFVPDVDDRCSGSSATDLKRPHIRRALPGDECSGLSSRVAARKAAPRPRRRRPWRQLPNGCCPRVRSYGWRLGGWARTFRACFSCSGFAE
jgi:hypothetical protein